MSKITEDCPIWTPTEARINNASVTRFIETINKAHNLALSSIKELYQWSVKDPELFWGEVWDFLGIIGDKGNAPYLVNGDNFINSRWFPHSSLNFAENLLKPGINNNSIAFFGEDKRIIRLAHDEIVKEVLKVQSYLLSIKIGRGDVVAGLLPNMPLAIIGMLAASSLGAIWTSCSPDFGASGIIDRFGQTLPKVLLTTDGYFYRGSIFPLEEKVNQILTAIPSIRNVIYADYTGTQLKIDSSELISTESLPAIGSDTPIHFERLPFSHPLYIMYSSGTTGKPKCIVHSAGGTLLEHLKEHVLHVDLKASDVITYQTTCGWMMWNWLVSGLGVGANIVLYDGYPFLNDGKVLFDLIDREKITVFGTNAKFISALEKEGLAPSKTHNLSSLHTILSTGSPLLPENFDYIYSAVKKDLCLSSISGGTDILGCFALGSPTLPVFRGELQIRSLGLNVQVWNEKGEPVSEEKGELVCTAPFPSKPVGFWNDPSNERYSKAYFERFQNIWCHGDYVELTAHDGMIFYGRSDAVLNPGGIRIGTAEIYRQVEKLSQIEESIVVGQDFEGDVRIVLFVKLRSGHVLDEALEKEIRQIIKTNASPFHVPKIIKAVPDIPKTRSGKITELAVRDMVNGKEVKDTAALANPEALHHFKL